MRMKNFNPFIDQLNTMLNNTHIDIIIMNIDKMRLVDLINRYDFFRRQLLSCNIKQHTPKVLEYVELLNNELSYRGANLFQDI